MTAHKGQTGTPRTPVDDLRDKILDERKKGNVVFQALPGEFASVNLDEFIKQPADGILYDLNRGEEISLTFLKDPKWVNDFAVALVIRKLKDQLSHADAAGYARAIEDGARVCDKTAQRAREMRDSIMAEGVKAAGVKQMIMTCEDMGKAIRALLKPAQDKGAA